jgi:hypothetical protein
MGTTFLCVFQPQFSLLRFDNGPDVDVFGEAAALDAKEWGVFVPAAVQVRSNHGQLSNGLGFELEANYFQVPWGKLIAEDWAVGANLASCPESLASISRMPDWRERETMTMTSE